MWHPTVIYMQDWNGCSSLEQDNGSNGDRISITLTDKRDGNTYTVAKLKDGKCWMTQDLNIGSTQSITLTPDDSNIGGNYSLPAVGNIGQDSRPIICNNGSFGKQYNYPVGTAGGSSNYSICPRKWRLPTSNEFQTLGEKYNNNSGNEFFSSPVNIRGSGIRCNQNAGAYYVHFLCSDKQSPYTNSNSFTYKYWFNDSPLYAQSIRCVFN